MEVIALVGTSGTGKSHRALEIAQRYGADTIIDDGILISGGHIIAGKSAKAEKNRIMAVRRAIFVLPKHAEEVHTAIEKIKPQKLLVIGTSVNMVQRITKTLGLPEIKSIIKIEEIASASEISIAKLQRLKDGKHVIPVPMIELKAHASGNFFTQLQSFLKRSRDKHLDVEKTIVRPIFSYYGKLIIDDRVIQEIVAKIIQKYEFIRRIKSITVGRLKKSFEENWLTISCRVILSYGINIPSAVGQLQDKICEVIEFTTGMFVRAVDIEISDLYVERKNPWQKN